MAYALRVVRVLGVLAIAASGAAASCTSILGPVLYLTALGVGLGKLVNRGGSQLGVPYLDFVAPGHARRDGDADRGRSSRRIPCMAAIRWTRQYHAMLATPLRVATSSSATSCTSRARLPLVGAIYLAILAAFGALHSPLAIARAAGRRAHRARAFAAPVSAFSAWLERDEGFNALFRFGVMPMFLFSGTFFPVTRLPHGVARARVRDAALARRRPDART